ncbi:SprT-like domain-containing protein [Haloterrigena sp. SYSU A558-1]|uniref:SprT-like domain-containing protein n=1 Tax=Haloterrigena gelatinilytica TaxID=2741724 RepID=A0ABX2LG43_9EURY|nr:SprT-like domain-containing protein [Haloterrigena gelatinilytica]NUC72572.1 SprT-like domain-containing protein [Haloterrigena gelatinilytica]
MTFRLPDSDSTGASSDDGFERPGDDLSPVELKRAIREYAETVEIDVPLEEVEIEISKQLKRTAGKAIRKNGQLKMRFAWKAYQTWGWGDDFEAVIRHELIHIWEYETFGKGGHGRNFKRKARELDAPRHCKSFASDEAKWFLVCSNCGKKTPRFRRSKVIENPHRYRTKCCNEQIEVETA